MFTLGLVLITGCGQSSKNYNTADSNVDISKENGFDTSKYSVDGEVYEEKVEEAKEAVIEETDLKGTGENESTKVQVDTKTQTEQKLIKNVNLTMDTTEFDHAVQELNSKVERYGGYIETSEFFNYPNSRRAYSITARIPQIKLDSFLAIVNQMSDLKLRKKSETTQDITLNYYDAKEHQKTLKEEQKRLLELLKTADNLKYIIQLEEKLSDLRYQIGSYESQIRLYDNLVNYSTVTMHVSEVEHVTMKEDDSVLERMGSGLSDSLYRIKTGGIDCAVWVVSKLPYLVFVSILLVIVVRFGRRMYKKRKKAHNGFGIDLVKNQREETLEEHQEEHQDEHQEERNEENKK